jgi:uncharacterized membrane protein YjjP (DUF1212 family)
MELGRALLEFGTPAHRVEDALSSMARRLGMDAQFFSTPTALIASFRGEGGPQTHLERCEPGEVNLEKLVLLDRAAEDVVEGRLSPREGAARVREVLAAPPRYGALLTTAAHGLCSAALAGVFGGGWLAAAVAGLVGVLAGGLAALGSAIAGFGRMVEFAAALVSAFIAHGAARWLGTEGVYVVTVTGVIVLIPGLTLTLALTELATLNLVSGAARLLGAGITFLKLGFGVALGGRLGEAAFAEAAAPEAAGMAAPFEAAALLLAALTFSVLFQARPSDTGWILVASVAALVGNRLGAAVLDPELAPCLGSFLVTLASNALSRWTHRPARVFLFPSIVLLVPGSVGFRSVALLLERDAFTAVETAFSMTLAATALVAGFLVASLLVPPRRLP